MPVEAARFTGRRSGSTVARAAARSLGRMTAAPPPAAPPAATMADVIARMQAIAAALPANDGLACFNRMYLQVTQQVDADVSQNYFADPAYLTELDVVFANLYFDAVNALTTSPDKVPTAWAPLLSARGNTAIEPIQFAVAGMNAHINHDLPLAVVTTCSAMGTSPDAGTHHADYQKVDQLLNAAEQSVRQAFENSCELAVDHRMQAVCNLVDGWCIGEARDVAWDSALALWAVRDIGVARDVLLDSIADSVAIASRCILVVV